MGKSNRTKEELERALKEYAKQIFELNEFLDIPQNTKLEDKIAMHSPRWNSIVREACADVFYFAKTLTYDSELYKGLDTTDQSKESIKSRLVGCYGEVIITVAHRRFSNNELSNGDVFIETEFISKLEKDLKESIKKAVYIEKREEREQGVTGVSEAEVKLAKRYLKFKEDYICFKGNTLSEEEFQKLYVKTHGNPEKSPEQLLTKLKDAVEAYNHKNIQKDSDVIIEDKEGNSKSILDDVENNDEEVNAVNRQLRINEIRFKRILNRLETFYKGKQKRKNSDADYWSLIISHYLLSEMNIESEFTKRFDDVVKDFEQRNFINKEVLTNFKQKETIPPRERFLEKLGKEKNRKYDPGKASTDTGIVEDFLKKSF